MGWTNEEELANKIYALVRPFIPISERQYTAWYIRNEFEEHGAEFEQKDSLLFRDIKHPQELGKITKELEPFVKFRDASDDVIQAALSGNEKEVDSAIKRFLMLMVEMEALK